MWLVAITFKTLILERLLRDNCSENESTLRKEIESLRQHLVQVKKEVEVKAEESEKNVHDDIRGIINYFKHLY